MRPAQRFTLATAIIALVLYAGSTVRSDEPRPAGPGSPVVPAVPPVPGIQDAEPILIIPATKLAESAPAPVALPNGADGHATAAPAATFSRAEYLRVYNSIPFSRAEYRANPNYRHDTAMEILTGNPRTQTIVKHERIEQKTAKPVPPPSRPSRPLTPFSGYSYFLGYPWMSRWTF